MKKELDKLAFFVGLVLGIGLILFIQWAVRFYKSEVEKEVVEDPAYNFSMIETLLDEYCLWDYDLDELYKGAYVGMVEAIGDKYTKVVPYTGETEKEIKDTMYIYIGAYITLTDGMEYPVVESVCEGENADKAGIKKGDMITDVNGVPVKGKNILEVIDLFKGNVDQDVSISIERKSVKIEINTKLQKKHEQTVFSKKLADGVGYIKVSRFIGDTPIYFEDVYSGLASQGVKSLVIDLRGNGGGETVAAVNLADLFLDKDQIVYTTKDKNNNVDEYKTTRDMIIDVPAVILIDGESASSSEIFALCMSDYKKAVLVGEKSFGKGISQKVILATKTFMLNVTYAYNYSPKGTCIHGVGIVPDIESKDNPNTEEDEVLAKAVEVLKRSQ